MAAPAQAAGPVIHEGQLRKLSRKALVGAQLWQTRWFVLRPGQGAGEHAYLAYHRDRARATSEEGKVIRLAAVTSARLSGDNRCRLELVSEQRSSKDESRVFLLEANTQEEAEAWLEKILDTDKLRWDASQNQRKMQLSQGLLPIAFHFPNGGVVRIDCSGEWHAGVIIERCLAKAREFRLCAATAGGDAAAVAEARTAAAAPPPRSKPGGSIDTAGHSFHLVVLGPGWSQELFVEDMCGPLHIEPFFARCRWSHTCKLHCDVLSLQEGRRRKERRRWREAFQRDLDVLLYKGATATALSPQGATAEADFLQVAKRHRLSSGVAPLGWRTLRDVELVAVCRNAATPAQEVPVPFKPDDRCAHVLDHLLSMFSEDKADSRAKAARGVKASIVGSEDLGAWLDVRKRGGLGSHLGDYAIVHEAVERRAKLCLELASEPAAPAGADAPADAEADEPPELCLDPGARALRQAIQSSGRVLAQVKGDAASLPPWHQWTATSLWDYVDSPFRVKVGEGFKVAMDAHGGPASTAAQLYVDVSLDYGGERLAGTSVGGVCSATTKLVPSSPCPSWNEWLDFDIFIANLPRETRLCASVYSITGGTTGASMERATERSTTAVSTKSGLGPSLVGTASCLLMDFEGFLRQGVSRLELWMDVHGEQRTSGYLFLTLDSYPLPIVFPSKEEQAIVHGIAEASLDSASSTGTPSGSRTSTGTDTGLQRAAAAAMDGAPPPEESAAGGVPAPYPAEASAWDDEGAVDAGEASTPHKPRSGTFLERTASSMRGTPIRTLAGTGRLSGHMETDEERLNRILAADPLTYPDQDEQKLLWEKKRSLRKLPHALPKVLLSVPWHNRFAVVTMHKLLEEWQPLQPTAALELFGARYADARVREYAVRCLYGMSDDELGEYILQLVQVIKAEPYHTSAIAHFLLERALQSPAVIGHRLFWNLRAELDNPSVRERYSVILRVYLRLCGSYRSELLTQMQAVSEMERVANAIKSIKGAEMRLAELRRLLHGVSFSPSFRLPLDLSTTVTKLRVEKCKYMDSKKLPLWLVFENGSGDPDAKPVYIIFKSGDDLRQDILTLQMMRIMDRLWKQHNLDLKMNCYGCIATGFEVGMLEVVLNSETTSSISKTSGGAMATLSEKPIADWLRSNNSDPDPSMAEAKYRAAVDTFVRSCAGYSVATCVLGIGDRHNDNIMCQRDGHLFHIDFGHILGNFKSKFGIKRETAKFVLTPDFAYVMGGRNSDDFAKYRQFCCEAYLVLRKEAALFINLFNLMLNSGMPELGNKEIFFLRKMLLLNVDEATARLKFNEWITDSLDNSMTRINNLIHSAVH